jgi:hypothetical protein
VDAAALFRLKIPIDAFPRNAMVPAFRRSQAKLSTSTHEESRKMRKLTWATAMGLALLTSTPVWAQRAVSFGGTAKPIVNVPIDTGNAVAPFPEAQLTKPKGFSLSDLVPGFVSSMFSNKPVVGRPQLPSSSPSGRAMQGR